MSSKQLRIKSLISRNLMDIVHRELKNPHIGMVSVNDVVVNDDYSLATVYVTFLGAKYPKQHLAELKKTEGYVRSSLAKKIDLYKVPVVNFELDETFFAGERLEEALRREEEQLDKLPKEDK